MAVFSFPRLALLLLFIHQAFALQDLCSSINTATTSRNSSIYQSNGLCADFCRPSYAFAILQYDGCYCSSYAPASTVSVSQCSRPCPGFPDELCGSPTLFGYIRLNIVIAGTRGASSSTAATSTTAPQATTTAAPPTTAAATSSTWTPTPILSVQTVTNQGSASVQTVTFIPTSPSDASQTAGAVQSTNSSSGGGGLSIGAAVGLTVGLVALAAIVACIVWFCLRKKRKEKAAEAGESDRNSANGQSASIAANNLVPARSMSENSRYMLATDGRNVAEDWRNNEEDFGSAARRSQLRHIDPRLDPYAPPYQNRDLSKSHESVNTIQDNHDYSRRVQPQGPILRATNPD